MRDAILRPRRWRWVCRVEGVGSGPELIDTRLPKCRSRRQQQTEKKSKKLFHFNGLPGARN